MGLSRRRFFKVVASLTAFAFIPFNLGGGPSAKVGPKHNLKRGTQYSVMVEFSSTPSADAPFEVYWQPEGSSDLQDAQLVGLSSVDKGVFPFIPSSRFGRIVLSPGDPQAVQIIENEPLRWEPTQEDLS